MTTIILVILGVLLAAAAVLFVIYYGGDAFGNGQIEAEAGRLVGEGAQMEAALELYYRQEGHYPTSDDPVAELIAAGYLDYQPLGTRTTEADRWAINYDAGMIMARLGTTASEESANICLKARQQLDLPAANTATGIYRCDGTDSPGGKLAGREPCCIGEVGIGGGPVAGGDGGGPENIYATACGNLGSMPVNTAAQKSAYMETALTCLSGKIIDTPIDGSSHNQSSLPAIGGENINWSSVSSTLGWQFISNGKVYSWMAFPRSDYSVYCQGKPSYTNWQTDQPFGDTEPYCLDEPSKSQNYMMMPVDVYPARLALIQSEFQKVIDAAAQRVVATDADYAASGGPEPSINGLMSDWYFTERGNGDGSIKITARMRNGSMTYFCDWFEQKFGTTVRSGDNCTNYSSDSYYELDSGNKIRSRQLGKLRSEMEKIAVSALQIGRYNRSHYDSAGGYTPDFNNFVTSWDIRSDSNGDMRVSGRLTSFGMRHFCDWYENVYGAATSTDRCVNYSSDGYFETFVTDRFRAAQLAKLRTEFAKVKDDIVRLNVTTKSEYTSKNGYTPDLSGLDYGGAWSINSSGGTYSISLRGSGFYMSYFCDWYESKYGASTSVDSCTNYTNDGYYYYKLPSRSGGLWMG